MLTQPNVVFLQEKIMELRQALFFDLSASLLKFPASLVNALHVDEMGQVWFFLSKPSQNANEFDREFRSRLDFYKKGKPFYLHVWGKACIVNDPEEINGIGNLPDEYKQMAHNTAILIRMIIQDIQYYPLHLPVPAIQSMETSVSPHSSAFIKTLQYIVKDIIPVFQSH